jgi:hypothetical protein
LCLISALLVEFRNGWWCGRQPHFGMSWIRYTVTWKLGRHAVHIRFRCETPRVILKNARRPDIHIYNQSRSEVASYYKYWSMGWSPEKIMTAVYQVELAAIDKIYQGNPVYSIEYDPVIANTCEYLPVGMYYRLEKKSESNTDH